MNNTISNYLFDESLIVYKLKNKISNNVYQDIFNKILLSKKGIIDINFSKKVKCNNVEYAFFSFSFQIEPPCLENNNSLKETKIAYLLVMEIEIQGNLFIGFQKRNINDISLFYNYINNIEYSNLISLININSKIKKINMRNIDISQYALLEKSYKSNDLVKNISGLQLNHYAMSNCRYSNNRETLSITFNNSRINKLGHKVKIDELTQWFEGLIKVIISKSANTNQLINSFAENICFIKGKYIPTAVLFIMQNIQDEIEKDESFVIEKKIKSKFKLLSYDEIDSLFRTAETFIEIKNENIQYVDLNDRCKIIKADLFNDYYIKNSTMAKRESLIKYIDKQNYFTLAYKDSCYRYISGTLYKDSKLLNSIDWVIDLFTGYDEMNQITSEKGWGHYLRDANGQLVSNRGKREKVKLQSTDKCFPHNSEFSFVESKFMDASSYFICDDMNEEWADHIKISPQNNSITFYLSKFGNHILSASAFQDIIGQAQKNLGNFTQSRNSLMKKKDYWSSNYESSGFKRMRNPCLSNSQDAIDKWLAIQEHPDFKKEIVLVVNFISKQLLNDKLEKLRKQIHFSEENEVYQILWFINSLLSNCKEQNISLKIICKK